MTPHQFRTRNNRDRTRRKPSNPNENAAKSTGPINILPLITVWLQVRVLPGHQQINGRCPLIAWMSHLIAWMSHRTRNAPLWSIVAVG
jgi:hypothetical protein